MLQLNFKTIKLHNFGPFTDVTVDLAKKGFCFVSGENHCPVDNSKSNGSGKSFIWSGICYALTGETINGIHSGLKNNCVEDKDFWTELEFSADGNEYVIKRGASPAKNLTILKNGTDMSGKTYMESLTKLKEELPELTKDLIASTIIIGQGMPNKFSSFTPAGRKELLEKLTKADFMIEDVKTRIGERMKFIGGEIAKCDTALAVSNSEISNLTRDLDNQRSIKANAKKPDFDAIIKEATERSKSIQTDLTEAENAVKSQTALIEDLNARLLSKSNEKSNTMLTLNERYSSTKEPLVKRQTELSAELRFINGEIAKIQSIKDVCPTCGHKLDGVHKPDCSDLLDKKSKITAESATLNESLNQALAKYNEYKAQVDGSFDKDILDLKTQINEAKNVLGKAQNDVNDFTHYKQLENDKITKAQYDKAHYDEWLASVDKAIDDITASLDKKNGEHQAIVDSQTAWNNRLAVVRKMDTLSKRDFRGYLLENIIAYLDKKAKDYCEVVFKTRDLTICIDGNDLDISYHNKMIDNLSGGEKTRVDLILQLAIRNLLQNYLGFNSNILVLDEITDFLDAVSCKAVISLLEKELATIESVFVISHHADELGLPIDSEIHIVKGADELSRIA